MAVILVLFSSFLLQLTAAIYALYLMKRIGGRVVWIALSAAIALMTVRRGISLSVAIHNYPHVHQSLSTEIVALLISVLILLGVLFLKPLFLSFAQSERKLATEKHRNEIILSSTPDGVCLLNSEGEILQVNPAFCAITGCSNQVLIGRRFEAYDENDQLIEDFLQQVIYQDQHRFDLSMHKKISGEKIFLDVTAQYLKEFDQRYIYLFFRDVTQWRLAEQELYTQKEKALVTLASIGDGVITTDTHGNIEYMNLVAEKLCRICLADVQGKPLKAACRLVDDTHCELQDDPVSNAIRKKENIYLKDNLILISNDEEVEYSVEVVVSPIYNLEGNIIGAVLILHDVTELRGMAQQLTYQATHDSLTGLVNRREFETRLEMAIHNAHRMQLEHVLFYMDLDQFKIINDTCGHMAGDQMLIDITELLKDCVRGSDTLARLGGDEFGVLLMNCSVEKARDVAEKMQNIISAYRFAWDDNIFETGVSIGVVPISAESGMLSDVLSAADSACYVAKERGRNTVHFYETDDIALAQHHGHMHWYQQIQRALEEGRFQIYMQSISPLNNSDMKTHCEVLLRMVSDKGELILPSRFISTAERYHMMQSIDRWVLRRLFEAMRDGACPLGQANSICAINLSGQSLGEEQFLDFVLALVNRTGVKLTSICFEITETAVISNIVQARRFISEMKQLGCSFALDDFGSGLSSFSYLKNLDVDYLKIDGSFVQGMLNDQDDYNMVSTINQIAHSLGLRTIAEFVENEQEIELLKRIGVDYIQGYCVGRPNPLLH